MKVFTLWNITMILKQGLDGPEYIAEVALAAKLSAPNVLWRLAKQACNIPRTLRILLLKFAYDIVLTLAAYWAQSDLIESGKAELVVFLFRRQDLAKFLISFSTLVYLIQLGTENFSMARLSTANLEQLFGLRRLGTRGDNQWERVFDCLVRGQMTCRIADNMIAIGEETMSESCGYRNHGRRRHVQSHRG
jgi:hypothetical protein